MDFHCLQENIKSKLTKSNDNNNFQKQELAEEIIIRPEKNRGNIKQTEKNIIKWSTIKYLNY